MRYDRAIAKLRKEVGLSRKQLGSLSGLGTTYVALVETGKETPSRTTLELLARALGAPSYVLMLVALEPGDSRLIRARHGRALGMAAFRKYVRERAIDELLGQAHLETKRGR